MIFIIIFKTKILIYNYKFNIWFNILSVFCVFINSISRNKEFTIFYVFNIYNKVFNPIEKKLDS